MATFACVFLIQILTFNTINIILGQIAHSHDNQVGSSRFD